MKHTRWILLTLLSAVLFVSPAGHTFASSGKALYERKCGRCHSTYSPEYYSTDDWPGLVRSMRDEAARTPIVEIYGEFATADSENSQEFSDGKISGYFIQASRLFKSKRWPTIRFGMLDYLDPGNDLGRDATKGNKDVRELALNFGVLSGRQGRL